MSLRWKDYFDIQLRFADRLARLGGIDPVQAVTFYTNLHRRFGFGRIIDGRTAEGWRSYVEQLIELRSLEERVAWTQRFYIGAHEEVPPDGERQFGCFGYDPPNREGQVRIHFGNLDSQNESGPLHHSNIDRRLAELRRMFTHVRRNHTDAVSVLGKSWLYHLPAYRRLFPGGYGESRVILTAGHRFDGMSSWGQFLDHKATVKPEIRDAFLDNLPRLDPDHPYLVFHYPVLRAEADIAGFYEMYGICHS